MLISKEILANVNAVKYSPCGKLLALPFSNELNIVTTSDAVKIFTVQCSARIQSVDWSIDCDHILCVLTTGQVEAFSISSPEWNCAIREGLMGIGSAVWSPKGSHIVTVAEFAVRLGVWSLTGRSVAFIENPLMKPNDKLSFSPDGGSLAVITGKIGQFNISLFSTHWTEVSSITCTEGITSPSVPLWSPDSLHISIWERNNVTVATLQIYHVETRQKIGGFTTENKNWEPRGVSSVVWSPNGQFLLIGCRNDHVYVLNHINWSVVAVFRHEKVVHEKCDIVREINGRFLTVTQRPVKFTSVVRKLPGVAKMSIGRNGLLLASLCQLLPAVVWIWNLETFSLLSVVTVNNRVVDLQWGREHKLSICDWSKVTLWHPRGTNQIHLPNRAIRVRKCVWRGSGDQFLLLTSDSVFTVSGL